MTTLAENDVAAGQPRAKPAPLPLAQVDEATVSVRLVVRLLGPLEVACGDRPVRIGAALGAVTQPPHAHICPAQVLG